MQKPLDKSDAQFLAQTINTAAVAIIATLIETRKPNQSYRQCVIQAISRVQAVDDSNIPVV